MNTTRALRLLALCLAASAWHCGLWPSDSRHVGGGSDTETLTGRVTTETGAAAARVSVKLMPADYDPSKAAVKPRTVVTDDSGRFVFDNLDSLEHYNLIAGKGGQRSWAFAESLKTGKDVKTLALARSAIFVFSLEYRKEPVSAGVAYFPGTDILMRCDGYGETKIDSVPMGVNHVVVESEAGWRHDSTFVIYTDSVDLKADRNGITCLQ